LVFLLLAVFFFFFFFPGIAGRACAATRAKNSGGAETAQEVHSIKLNGDVVSSQYRHSPNTHGQPLQSPLHALLRQCTSLA
jgi:hypothetical protein